MHKQAEISALLRQRRRMLALIAALALWFGAVLVACGVGAVAISPGAVAAIIGRQIGLPIEPTWNPAYTIVIWQLRLPRVVLGSLVGAALALAGATFQGLLRNPLADPYVLGISAGASLGAVVSIAFGLGGAAWFSGVPFFAFTGALGSAAIVFMLGRKKGRLPVTTLLLAGVALSSFLSSLVSLIVLFSGERMGSILFWLMGGLSGAEWHAVTAVLPYLVLAMAVLAWHSRALNVLAFGEDAAANLGVNVERTKWMLFITASLLTAAAVAVSGVIGFVGLIIPHIVRLLAGPDHRGLLPLSLLFGAAFMVLADTLARSVLAPQELPVGAVTAICGAPYFIHLLRQQGERL
jgi:iron complex transport system permease protein